MDHSNEPIKPTFATSKDSDQPAPPHSGIIEASRERLRRRMQFDIRITIYVNTSEGWFFA